MNGCTNFMLTKMESEGLSYKDCLAEASALGYAEEDPTLDVGGFDARSKLAILIRLAFGVDVDETEIAIKGIEDLETVDFDYAKDQLGGTIKLLGVATKTGDSLTAFVTPCFVPDGATLAAISDATNAVEVDSREGKGQGPFPST
jgi:homoserine dehydrogenase